MIGNELKDTKEVSIAEVLELLEKRKKRSPLGYEQQTSYDYCEKFAKLPVADTKKLIEELMKIENMIEKTAIKISDIMPIKESQLKIILAKDRVELSPDGVQKVFEIIMSYKDKIEEYEIKKQKKREKDKKEEEKIKAKEEKEEEKIKAKEEKEEEKTEKKKASAKKKEEKKKTKGKKKKE